MEVDVLVSTWQVDVEVKARVDAAGQDWGRRGWLMWRSMWVIQRAWGQLGSTWPLPWALTYEGKGEPGRIGIQSRSVTYLVGLPLLGSPLVISNPSVATYNLLTSLEDVLNPCDMAKFNRVIITLINSKSIRILNISVEKRLTNDPYKFPGLRDEWEV